MSRKRAHNCNEIDGFEKSTQGKRWAKGAHSCNEIDGFEISTPAVGEQKVRIAAVN